MPFIEDLCEGSSSWGPALSSLTLTGLQPCFEDLVLLGAVYVGALACHAARLVLRDLLGPLKRHGGLSRASWRTLELYLLSLLHSGAWMGFALCCKRTPHTEVFIMDDLG